MEFRDRSALPVLVNVTVWAGLVVLIACALKVRDDGLRLTAGTGVDVPVPDSDMDCGLLPASSAMLRLPVRLPLPFGMNETLMVQLPPAGTVLGLNGQVVVSLKSAAFVPLNPMLLMVRAALPVLVTVTV
jgi:hypothetical protein